MTRVTLNRVQSKSDADRAGDRLCEAVAEWWRAMGGVPLVASSITLRGGERAGIWELSIRVTGTRPDLTFELPPKKPLKLRHQVAKKKRQR